MTIHDSETLNLDPVYMLYFHATEMALKAFMAFKGKDATYLKSTLKHNLVKIYDEAVTQGLDPGHLKNDLSNLVNALHGSNKEEGLRYFSHRHRLLPEVHDARKIVAGLTKLIEAATGYVQGPPGPAVRLDVVYRVLPKDAG